MSVLALTAACGSDDSASASDDGDATSVRFALDWTPNTNHTGLYVAMKEGYFADAGIDVEILPYSDTSTETILENGGAEFGIGFESSAVFAAASGGTNTSVMSVLQHNAVASRCWSPATTSRARRTSTAWSTAAPTAARPG